MSLGSLFNVKQTKVAQWVSEWQGHLLSCQVTAKKNKASEGDGTTHKDGKSRTNVRLGWMNIYSNVTLMLANFKRSHWWLGRWHKLSNGDNCWRLLARYDSGRRGTDSDCICYLHSQNIHFHWHHSSLENGMKLVWGDQSWNNCQQIYELVLMLKVFSTSFHDNIGWLKVFSVSEKILDTRHVLVGSTTVVQNKQQQKIAFNVDFIFTNCM